MYFFWPPKSFMQFNIKDGTKIRQVMFQFGCFNFPSLNPESVTAKTRESLG